MKHWTHTINPATASQPFEACRVASLNKKVKLLYGGNAQLELRQYNRAGALIATIYVYPLAEVQETEILQACMYFTFFCNAASATITLYDLFDSIES
jgi:hypothetical protein